MNLTRILSGRFVCKGCSGTGSRLIVFLLLLLLPGCKSKTSSEGESGAPPENSLELTFTYGSEKEKWISAVTGAFNRAGNRTSSGKRIYVHAYPMGSGEAIDEVMEGRRQPHIISPACRWAALSRARIYWRRRCRAALTTISTLWPA